MRSYTRPFIIAAVGFITVILPSVSCLAGTRHIPLDEIGGTWKLEPSTFTVVELAIPNSFPRPQFPTTFAAFELVLKRDGSFVATNVPAGFFFENWPAMAECSGLWNVKTNWALMQTATRAGTTNLALPAGANATNGYSSLELSFNKPALASWFRPVYRLPGQPSPLAATLGPWKDETRTYEWGVSLVRQVTEQKR